MADPFLIKAPPAGRTPPTPPPTPKKRGRPVLTTDQLFAVAQRVARNGGAAAFLKIHAPDINALSQSDQVKLNAIISPALGQTARQDIATTYSKGQPLGLAEKIVSVPLRATYQVADSLAHSPAGAVQAAKVVGPALYHAARGGTTPGQQSAYQDAHPAAGKALDKLNQLGTALARSTVQDVKHPLERPGYLALDALAVANAAAKAGSLAGVLKVPAERTVAYEGGVVQPHASPATITRAVQHQIDRLAEQHPTKPVIGARARTAARIPAERQREFDRASADATPFAVARTKLSKGEDFAYDVLRRYGAKAPERIDQEIEFRKQKIKDATSLVEKAHQRKRLIQLQHAHSHVLNPSPKLQQAVTLGRDLTHKAQQTAIDVGQLTPETATLHVHESSVAGTGRTAGEGAFYAPDVARPSIKSIAQRSASSVTGKPRPLVKQSQQILFTQGRARAGSKLTLENFQKTTRYAAHLQDIKAAAKYAKPLNPDIPGGLEPGHRYFNPEGAKLPRSFKDAPAAADLEGLTPNELAHHMHGDFQSLMTNTFPDEASLTNIPQHLRGKVSQIDEKIARAFEGGTRRPQSHGVVKALGSIFDTANDTTKAALIYLKPSYVPVNYAGNVAFGAIHQGPWLPVNLAKASERLGHFKPETLRRMDAETGQGSARSLITPGKGPLKQATSAIANVEGQLADRGPRRAAFIHEAAARGYKTDAEVHKLLTDPKLRPVLNQVGDNANNAMVDFRTMPQWERDTIGRAVFIYPWIRGATKYGLRLPIDRPLRSAFLAHLGEQGQQDIQKKLGQLVSYLDVIPVGKPKGKLGTTIQKVVSPASVTPFGTAKEALQTAERTITGQGPGRQLIQYVNPGIKALFEAGTGYNTFTGQNYPKGTKPIDIAGKSLYGSAPLVNLYKGLSQPAQTEPFTGPPGRQATYAQGGPKEAVGRFLVGGLYPRELNVPAAQAKGLAERQASLPTPERAYRNDLVKIQQEARTFKVPGGVPPEVLDDLTWRRDLDMALTSHTKHGTVTPKDKAATAAALFASRYPDSSTQVVDALKKAKTEDDYKALYSELRGEGLTALSQWTSEMNAAEREQRAAAAG